MKDDDFAVRIQFVCGEYLVAECIVHYSMAASTWARYANLKARKNLPIGGSLEYRADLPRRFDIPVGSKIVWN